MSQIDENVELVQRWFDAYTKNDPDSLKDVFADDYVSHHPDGVDLIGLESMAKLHEWLHQTDISVDALKIFGDGDRAGALIRMKRDLHKVDEIQIYRIFEGRIAKRWIVLDDAALQLLKGWVAYQNRRYFRCGARRTSARS